MDFSPMGGMTVKGIRSDSSSISCLIQRLFVGLKPLLHLFGMNKAFVNPGFFSYQLACVLLPSPVNGSHFSCFLLILDHMGCEKDYKLCPCIIIFPKRKKIADDRNFAEQRNAINRL